MKCLKCKNQVDEDSKFCVHCGSEVREEVYNHETEGSVDKYFFDTRNKCQHCGAIKPLRKAHYYKNIGMLLARRNQEIQGYFCKQCNKKLFLEYFMTDLFLGWWGTISFLITPFYLLFNLWNFIPSLWLKKEFENKG